MRWTHAQCADRTNGAHDERTAKSCGPDAPVLASSCGGEAQRASQRSQRRWQDELGHRGEHDISRKAIAQGMPECLRLYLYARVRFSAHFCTRDRGCSVHPAFPAPSRIRGTSVYANLGRHRAARTRGSCRKCLHTVIASEAKQSTSIGTTQSNGLLRCARNDADRPRRMDPPHARGTTTFYASMTSNRSTPLATRMPQLHKYNRRQHPGN